MLNTAKLPNIAHTLSYHQYAESTDASLLQKVKEFNRGIQAHRDLYETMYGRVLLEGCQNQVLIRDPATGNPKRMRMFGSNNYLGLTTHPSVKEAAFRAVQRYGVGSGGVPLLSGTLDIQRQLEAVLAPLKSAQAAMVFTSGYVTNIGTISGLVRRKNLILHDKLNHASIIDGSILCGARISRFPHNDVDRLDAKLDALDARYESGVLVAIDGVYSMDGDIAPVDRILPVVRRHGALLLVDDAHATGVIGDHGAGTMSHYRLDTATDTLITGTLSKALGGVGGFVAGPTEIIEYLRIYARSNMFSTSLPPAVCAAALEAIRLMQETDVVSKLKKNHHQVRSGLQALGFDTADSEAAIIPVMIPTEEVLLKMALQLYEDGIFVNVIKSPVVPPNRCRFRVSVMATHTPEDIEHLLDAFLRAGQRWLQ